MLRNILDNLAIKIVKGTFSKSILRRMVNTGVQLLEEHLY